nr:hypothetical protein [Actinomycetospora corticicola]
MAFAERRSVYADALVWTAVEEDVVLLMPSSACGLAWARLDDRARPVLEVLLGLPVAVADDLGAGRAREIGQLLRGRDGRLDIAHAAVCSRQRGWPLVTTEPESYAVLDVDLEIEPLI